MISGLVNPAIRIARGDWARFNTVHIFPLNAENVWIQCGYGRWITDMDDTNRVSKINSLQNGMLLREDIHSMFDQYLISVNPDDHSKIVVFEEDMDRLDGRVLDPVCRDPNNMQRVSNELLRWHYRQSVLADMRGAGEPIFEHDFAGEDMIKVISGKGMERRDSRWRLRQD